MHCNGLGKFIHYRRKSLSPEVSLNSFAFDNDIDSAILSRIERELQDVKFSVLRKIAKGFGQKVSEFISDFENSQFYIDSL